jgi:uncharacterized protein (TIGR03000 family)
VNPPEEADFRPQFAAMPRKSAAASRMIIEGGVIASPTGRERVMRNRRFPVLFAALALTALLILPPRVVAWPGLLNTDYPNLGWYLFKGPIYLPRWGIPQSTGFNMLYMQHVGIGYGYGWGYGYGLGWGSGYGPGWGFGPGYGYGWNYPMFGYGRSYRRPPPRRPMLQTPPPFDPYAHFLVHVPADAELWLEDTQMHQTGSHRTFISPPLEPGATFAYTVRARWTEDGQVIEQSRDLVVHSGKWVSLTFPLAKEEGK